MSNHNASDTSSIPAKHARTASDAKSRPYPPDPQSDLIPLRKRTRGNPLAPTQDDSVICPSPVPLVVERRRVNPDSLAKRLGPDLVRDMEKHIYPGNKEMPTFAVRKELQERYNIDRRHIYDYFHSRGLRVVKEDRHGNLLRAREKNRRALFTDVTNLHYCRVSQLTHVCSDSMISKFQDDLPSRIRTHRMCPKSLQTIQRASASLGSLRNSPLNVLDIK